MPKSKPRCNLIGQDGNIYNLGGIAARTLKENGMEKESKEMWKRIEQSKSYDEALCVITDYVIVVGMNDEEAFETAEDIDLDM